MLKRIHAKFASEPKQHDDCRPPHNLKYITQCRRQAISLARNVQPAQRIVNNVGFEQSRTSEQETRLDAQMLVNARQFSELSGCFIFQFATSRISYAFHYSDAY